MDGWQYRQRKAKKRATSRTNKNLQETKTVQPFSPPSEQTPLDFHLLPEVRSNLLELVNVLPVLGDDSLVLVSFVDVKLVLELELVELLRVELDLGVFESFPPPSGFDLGEFGEFGVAESEVLLESTSPVTESSVPEASSTFLECTFLRVVVFESGSVVLVRFGRNVFLRFGRKFSILLLGSIVVELTLREFSSRLNIGRDFVLRVDGRRS